jgi:hypothetical protein
MKENYTVIKETFDTNTGVTTVTINTDFGAFTGTTAMDDIDAVYPSVHHAYAIALAKAQRKWAKAMIIICREKVRALEGIIKQFPICSNPQPGSHEAQLVRMALEEAAHQLYLWTKRRDVMSEYITDRIKSRDKIVEKYNLQKSITDKND